MRGIVLHRGDGVNFPALAADGVRFTVLSASVGTDGITPHLAERADDARRAGIAVAVYHDLTAVSVTQALAEADHFRRTLASLDFSPPWAICRAESPRLPRDPARLACMIRAFTERIRGDGFRPMLYTGEDVLKILGAPPCELLLARWSVPEARALSRNPRIWEYGEGRAGDIPRAILLRGYFSSLPDSGGDFSPWGNIGSFCPSNRKKSSVICPRKRRYTV